MRTAGQQAMVPKAKCGISHGTSARAISHVAAELKADIVSLTEVLPPLCAPPWTVGTTYGLSAPRPQGRRSGAAATVISKALWPCIGAMQLSQ